MQAVFPIRFRLKRLVSGALVAAAAFLYIGVAQASTTTISGTISYTYDGALNLSDTGQFIVLLTSNPYGNFGGNEYVQAAQISANVAGPGPYSFTYRFANLPGGSYYLSVYRDLNANGILDQSEPWGAYPSAGPGLVGSASSLVVAGNRVFLNGNPNQGPFNITIKDAPNARVSGAITYNGGRSGTLYVKATLPNPYSCGNPPCSQQTVAVTTTAWLANQTSFNYSMLLVAATHYTMSAILDTTGGQLSGDDSNPFLPSVNAFPADGFDLAALQVKNDVSVSTTIRNPGWANTGNTSPAAPNNNATITGTLKYNGTKTGQPLVAILDSNGEARESVNIAYMLSVPGGVRTGPFSGVAFTLNVASPTVGWYDFKEYVVIAGLDVDGNSLLSDDEPRVIANEQNGGAPILDASYFVGSSSNVGVLTMPDPTGTNTGEIDGTVFIATGTLTSGTIVVKANNQRPGNCDNCRDSGYQVIPVVPGQASYNYQITKLDSATNYFLIAFVDFDKDARFTVSRATFNNNGSSGAPYWIGEPVGSLGQSVCNNGCNPTQPVAVATNVAMATFFGNTCGPSHTASCAGTPATVTGANIILVVPSTQAPAAVTLSTTFIHVDVIMWAWNDAATENGFRLIDTSSNNVSGDLDPHTLAYTDIPPFTPNTPVTRALVSFNDSGSSTSPFKTVFTQTATPDTANRGSTVTAPSIIVGWSSGTQGTGPFNPLSFTTYTVVLSTVIPFRVAALSAPGNITAFSTAPAGTQPEATVSWGGSYLPNTTYYAYVNAINGDGIASVDGSSSGYALVGQGVSPPAAPASVASTFTVVNATHTLSVFWSSNGNAPGTFYNAALSTVAALLPSGLPEGASTVILQSTAPAGATTMQASIATLKANTTYYLFVQTKGNSGLDSPYIPLGSTSTWANAPFTANIAPTVTASTMVVRWASGTAAGYNPLNTTLYTVLLSTVTPFSAAALTAPGNIPALSTTPVGSQPQASVSWGASYLPSQAYHAYVNAVNNNGVATTFVDVGQGSSPPALPTAVAQPFTAVNSTGVMSVSWSANGNAVAVTTYTVALSTVGSLAAGAIAAGNTVSLTTAPAGATLQATLAGLKANTTYYMYARTLDNGGNGLDTAFVLMGATSTLVVDPVNANSGSTVTFAAMTVGWASGTAAGYNPLNTTLYTVLLSTVTPFSAAALTAPGNILALSTTPVGSQPQATVSWGAGYLANQLYYAYVNAVNNNGIPSPGYATVGSGTAPPLPPTVAAIPFSTVNATHTLTVFWTANTNAPGTNYNVALSTVAALLPSGVPEGASTVILPSTAPAGTNLQASIATGLNANTTYYLFVQTVGGSGLNSPYIPLGSTATLAALPAAAAFPAATLSASQYYLGWASGSVTGGFNPPNSRYTVFLSTVGSLAAGALSAPANQVLLTTAPAGAPSAAYPLSAAVLANTTYYVYVNAVNRNGIPTLYVMTGATATLADVPASAVSTFSFVAANTATATWSVAGNPVDVTTYTVVLSTVPSVFLGAAAAPNDKSTVVAATGATPSASLSGLASNTLYYLFVRAVNFNGVPTAYKALGSTATLANPPLANNTVSTFTAVGSTTTSLRWLSNNPPQNTPVANSTYTIVMSTVNALPAALTAGGNVVLTTAPAAGASVGATISGLAANTTYFAYINTVNPGGTGSAYVPNGSTVTLAALAIALAPTSVGSSSITANWGANGNSTATIYIVQISSDGFSTLNVSTRTQNTSFTFTGLSGGFNFNISVRVINYDGSLGGTTVLPPATTSGGSLAAPTAAAFSAVLSTGLTASWTDATNPAATVYRVQIATASDFSAINYSSVTANKFVRFGNGGAGVDLSSNTLYYLQVQSSGAAQGALSAFTALGSTFTLAAPPTGSAAAAVYASSATITWNANGNPTATIASVDRSSVSNAFGVLTTSAGVFSLSDTSVDLAACTSYWFRVKNINGNGLATAYDTTIVNFLTKPATPTVAGAFTAASVASSRVTLSWLPSPTGGVSGYKIYYDAGTGVQPSTGTAPLITVSSVTTSTTTAVLVSSNAYIFRLSVVHGCGVEEGVGVFATAAATGTLSALRAGIVSPQSGAVIGNQSNSLTLSAEALSGSDTPSRVVFQYKKVFPTVDPAFIVIDTATLVPFTASWQLTPKDLSAAALAPGTYILRAVAYDAAGNFDPQPASVNMSVVDPGAALANLTPNFVQETVVGGIVTKTQVISNGAPNVVSVQSPGGLVVNVDMPANCLGANTPFAALTVLPNPAIANLPAAPAGLAFLRPEMILSNGMRPSALTQGAMAIQVQLGAGLTLQSAVNISISYPDATNSGIITGTNLKPSDVKLYSASEVAGSPWVQDLVMLAPDLVNHKIRGTTSHFSFFGGFGAPAAANLSNLRVYPVPWKPNGSNPDEGVRFTPGNANSGIIFDGLTGDATITIYNINGSRVARFSNNGGGTVQWDGRNDSGQDVATGGYFAVISGAGSASVVKKLAVIR